MLKNYTFKFYKILKLHLLLYLFKNSLKINVSIFLPIITKTIDY